jgi:hypothetical protein
MIIAARLTLAGLVALGAAGGILATDREFRAVPGGSYRLGRTAWNSLGVASATISTRRLSESSLDASGGRKGDLDEDTSVCRTRARPSAGAI